jgi:hypothetical protein
MTCSSALRGFFLEPSPSLPSMQHGRWRPATHFARTVRLVMDAVAKEAPGTEHQTGIASASGSLTKFVEIRRAAVFLKTRQGRAKIVSVR